MSIDEYGRTSGAILNTLDDASMKAIADLTKALNALTERLSRGAPQFNERGHLLVAVTRLPGQP